MPEWSPLELWRANWVVLALWRVVHGEADWVVAEPQGRLGWGGGRALSGRSEAPAFLPIHVPALWEADIRAHDLRLWRDGYRAYLRGLSPGERMALEAYLGRGRPSRLAYWHAPSRAFRLNFPEDVVAVSVGIARLCEVLPIDKAQGSP